MRNLRHYLDVTANGANQDWEAQVAPTAWEAVGRNSTTTTLIQAALAGERSDFFCGDGPVPPQGFVSAVTVHYRVRTTDEEGAPEVLINLLRDGAQVTAGVVVGGLPTPPHHGGAGGIGGGGGAALGGAVSEGWLDGEYRVVFDPDTSARFVAPGLTDLGCMVEVSTSPRVGGGYIQVSALWLEIEWVRSADRFDPMFFAVTPDLIVGDLAWNTTGTQTAQVRGSNTSLTLNDSSSSDWRAYNRAFAEFSSGYVTEVTTRFEITTSLTTEAFVYRIAQLDDGVATVDLCCFVDSDGEERIGLSTGALDRDDTTAYINSALLDWTENHHYRLVVDRDDDMDRSNHVQVFVDYDDTAVLESFYGSFIGTSGSGSLRFGTGDATYDAAQCQVIIGFIDWYSYAKTGTWRHWEPLAEGDNAVVANTDDEFIQPPIFITPPGITTPGSSRCCQLQVQDLTDECSARTFFAAPDPNSTYDLAVDYRVDTLATDAKLVVQRASDFYYWNNGGSAWQSGASDVTLSYSPTRTRVAAMSDITTTLGEQLVIKVRNDTGAAAAHNVFVYKIGLTITP